MSALLEIFSLSAVPQEKISDVVAKLLQNTAAGDWIFLEGDLGAGKTTLTAELARQLGHTDAATSPTFSLLNIYRNNTAKLKLIHLDLYRLKSGREVSFIGLETEFDKKTLAVFEWASRVSEDEWQDFFEKTHCTQPRKVFVLEIASSGNARDYVLSQLQET